MRSNTIAIIIAIITIGFMFTGCGQDNEPSATNPVVLQPSIQIPFQYFEIVSVEPLQSGLPEYWRVGIKASHDLVTVHVSKSVSKSELTPGKMIFVTELNEGRSTTGQILRLYVGKPAPTYKK